MADLVGAWSDGSQPHELGEDTDWRDRSFRGTTVVYGITSDLRRTRLSLTMAAVSTRARKLPTRGTRGSEFRDLRKYGISASFTGSIQARKRGKKCDAARLE